MNQIFRYAFTLLYHRYMREVDAVSLRMLKSVELAEGVVQEVFLKIWQSKTRYMNAEKIS